MKSLFRSMSMAAACCAGVCIALPAAAQFAKADDAIEYRKAGMFMMGTHLGRVAAMASGKVAFDAKVAAENAETATMLSLLPYAGFIPGSDKGDTKAKPEIWTEPDKFKAAASKMQEEMVKLNAAAKAGNLDAIKVAVGATGKQCKACHDTYRKE